VATMDRLPITFSICFFTNFPSFSILNPRLSTGSTRILGTQAQPGFFRRSIFSVFVGVFSTKDKHLPPGHI